MSTVLLILGIISIFFALNMGASGIAPSFAAAFGAKLITRKSAVVLFAVFVILGAIILGRNVAVTLGGKLLAKEFISLPVALIIVSAASLSLFMANILKIPQSTSQVTVGAITGAGLYFKALALKILFFNIVLAWVMLPILSFLITFFVFKIIYPPCHGNFYLYQKIFSNEKKLQLCTLVVSCYVALAIGANNVGNVAGPLYGAGVLGVNSGLILFAPLFGVGAWFMGKGTIETTGRDIVPIGLVSSSVVSFVTATLLIFASILGIPQSLVQLNVFAIFAISCMKNGHKSTMESHVTTKTLAVWVITPLISTALAYFSLTLLKR
ncbi:MAG: inorganic phosphate transporter [Candidatus Latescibacter sp.]|nr:inorganic phosphate transporter [Candidatus Latescibacter sp.]